MTAGFSGAFVDVVYKRAIVRNEPNMLLVSTTNLNLIFTTSFCSRKKSVKSLYREYSEKGRAAN